MVSRAEGIRKKLEKIDELGLFSKRIKVIRSRTGKEITTVGWYRIALEQGYLDRYGNPNDELAYKSIMRDKMTTLTELYYDTIEELIMAKKESELLHRDEEPHYLNDYFKLYRWVIDKLRLLKIITPHDQAFLQPVFDNLGDFQGMKALTQEQVDQLEEREQ